jgi:uncharacterized repeat protein (TIGR03837 family)
MPAPIPGLADRAPRWDVFCRVVDNLGDAAVCWRLARLLSTAHGLRPRLWVDRPDALALLVPGARGGASIDGVRIERWDDADPRVAATRPDEVADVVIAGFACSLPDAYRAAMVARRPVWVNLEYLSAEDWVPSHHGLPSPKPDGLVEHFFFPGLHPATGGLLREPDLLDRRDAYERDADARATFLASIGVDAAPGIRLASLFCYPDEPVRPLLDAFAARPEPWRVLVPAGIAPAAAGHRVAVPVPFLPQRDYDRLLWSCALNLVRGEDSLARALWSGRAFVWQAYRQQEGAHRPKARALVEAWCEQAAPPAEAAAAFAAVHEAWNDAPETGAVRIGPSLDAFLDWLPAIGDAARRWSRLAAESPDLSGRLVGFVADRL